MSKAEESGDGIGNVDQMISTEYEDRTLPVALTSAERQMGMSFPGEKDAL